jgi:hypothetical protein
MPLKDISIRNAKASSRPRKLSDGGGLHVLIQPTGSKLWRLAYRFAGKQKTLALGAYPIVSLEEARRHRDERLSCWSSGLPWGVLSQDGIEDDEELAHAGCERELFALSCRH